MDNQPDDSGLAGRVVIITGAAGGIGVATARALACRGAHLVLVDRAGEAITSLAAELGPDAAAFDADIASESDMAAMAAFARDRHGRIDALIAAAGILRSSDQPRMLAETPFEEWRHVIDVNLTGTFLSNRAVLPAMLAQKRGDIINISSVSGRQGRAFDGPYSASKAGIIGLSEALAEEVGRDNIRVQTLLPNAVDTGLWTQAGGAALKPPTMLPPERIADLIVYLLTLPRDTYLLNSVVAALPARRRKSERAPP
jgi:NAD(P)-dependent dehydrogenase (short-subunit alcohol dehydrogenase family)